ncbi:MAG: integration host factor subunit alpha [bacterium]
MTKADIVERIQQLSRSSRTDVADIVDLVFERIKASLESGENVKLSGFGNFVIHDKRARRGRNPQTGHEITISSRRVLSFRPSQLLKERVKAARELPRDDRP